MRSRIGLIFLLSLMYGLISCSDSDSSSSGTAAAGDATAGKTVYETVQASGLTCLDCHGADGKTDGSSCPTSNCPDVTIFSDTSISSAVRNGPGTMPSYATSIISADSLNDLLAYINTL